MFHSSVRTLVLVACLFAASVPGTTIAQTPEIDPSWPDWLKEAMAKEHQEIDFEPLSLGPVKTVMPGKITEQQEIEPGSVLCQRGRRLRSSL